MGTQKSISQASGCPDGSQNAEAASTPVNLQELTNPNRNSSTSSGLQAEASPPPLDNWSFVMEEYDLMDYLKNLSARYDVLNSNQTDEQFLASQQEAEGSKLEAKSSSSSSSPSFGSKIISNSSSKPAAAAAGSSMSETATSLASLPADQEIGESSWQYGIFDRFTRPRSSSTTAEPKFTLDPLGGDLDLRQFNSDECGLRFYDREPANDFLDGSSPPERQYSDSAYASSDHLPPEMSDASKELNHRRQRPSTLLFNKQSEHGYPHRWTQLESAGKTGQATDAGATIEQQQQQSDSVKIANWPNKSEKDNYDSYKKNFDSSPASQQQQQHFESPMQNQHQMQSGTGSGDEFNLLSRRNWLQQQLGNTLQMFAFNASLTGNQSLLADLLPVMGGGSQNQSVVLNSMQASNIAPAASEQLPVQLGTSGPVRENLMRQFGNKKLSKSLEASELQFQRDLKGRQDELKLEARVIGGNDARLGDSPWSVSLQALVSRPGTGQVEYRHYCGGTIISEQYILTAAHCLDFMVGRESRLFVVVGDLNWRISPASQHGRRMAIDKLIIHSGYKNTAFGHDIGLIRTKERIRPLKVNGRYIVNSVCLPEKGVEHTGEAELVGWGLFSNRNEMADSLQIAEVPILPRPLCVDLYRRRTGLIQWLIGIELITEKQVCAGTFGRGICQGDSGSALVYNVKMNPTGTSQQQRLMQQAHTSSRHPEESRATIIGIVAFGGIRRCSYQSLPGVYMQTSKYMDWILPRIQP